VPQRPDGNGLQTRLSDDGPTAGWLGVARGHVHIYNVTNTLSSRDVCIPGPTRNDAIEYPTQKKLLPRRSDGTHRRQPLFKRAPQPHALSPHTPHAANDRAGFTFVRRLSVGGVRCPARARTSSHTACAHARPHHARGRQPNSPPGPRQDPRKSGHDDDDDDVSPARHMCPPSIPPHSPTYAEPLSASVLRCFSNQAHHHHHHDKTLHT
jgi:hypothetical protein